MGGGLLIQVEATGDCGWSHKDRIELDDFLGSLQDLLRQPAWLHSIKTTDKASWESIVKLFKGEYGVHFDPRTAYQRCHELQYEQFGSAQGLVAAMREYQCMAPQKLTDVCLESILWNKVPVELQREVKEITTDGSVHELLQKLLKAEAVIQERAQQEKVKSNELTTGSGINQERYKRNLNSSTELTHKPTEFIHKSSGPCRDGSTGEMQAKNIKRFNCKEKGHFASSCPKGRPLRGSLRVHTDQIETMPDEERTVSEEINLWTRVLTSKQSVEEQSSKPHMIGPAYKVDMTVGGVPTRAFLDYGSQVTIVRHQLPLIREKQGWLDEQCLAKTNCKNMDTQPVGAMGQELGTCGIVVLQLEIDETGQNLEIP